MPIYEYECKSCGWVLDCVRSIKNRNNCPQCPKCKKETIKITTKMQFRLKGRGWAADGYTGQKGHADLV